tara:strand:+ start:50 stop:493 length:444 start_codon:yes stop_codon:yes gene_type:complete
MVSDYLTPYGEEVDMILCDKLRELKDLQTKVTRSDLQGIVMVEAKNLNKEKSEEIENIFLLFCDEELNINEAKRFLLDLVDLSGGNNKMGKNGYWLNIDIVDILAPSNVDTKRYAVDSNFPGFSINSVKFETRSKALKYAKNYMRTH